MIVDVAPRRLVAEPGRPVTLSLTITNTGDVISGHVVRVLGLDPRWVTVDQAEISLFPGTTAAVIVTLTLPAGTPAGERQLSIQVRELTPPEATAIADVELEIPAARQTELRLDPMTVTAGAQATYGLVVENTGNTPVSGVLVGSDEEDKLRFRFTPQTVDLAPGEHAAVEVRTRARRRIAGSPVVRPFLVRLDDGRVDDEDAPSANASFMQKPLLSRGALSLVGLLGAISVFAVVITFALSGVVGRSAADRDLALQVAQAQQNQGTAGNAAMSGTVRLLTSSAPVPGVTVEVFSAADTANPVTSVAPGDDGGFRLSGLTQGSYKLRFRGAGFAELWYPQSLTADDAKTIDLQAGQTASGLNVALGGLPATLSGTVTGDDPSGATVALELAGTGVVGTSDVSAAGAVLQTVTVGSDGSFTISQVPSPSVYDLAVSKPGYATEVQRVDVGGGEDRSGIQIRLRKGDGLVAGHVTGADGPIGGATISATYGGTTVQTVSLTRDDVGAFTLRNLPTPSTLTVVVSKPGLASQTLTLTLTPGQQLTGVGVTLGGAAGSLSGSVTTLADHAPAPGVSVTVTNGALTVQTVTQSTGTAGAWSVSGLAVPSTYTVTFSRPDLAPQTVAVSLDAFGVATSSGVTAASVDASMRSATAVLRGTAREKLANGTAGGPIGEVTIALSSGTNAFQVTTASVPSNLAGQYEIDRLPPGTYTVSVSRIGTRTTSTIVTLAAGDVKTYDPLLAQPASVSGTVTGPDGHPLGGAEVHLYRASLYPKTPDRITTTDASGHFVFNQVDAPEHYVVEFYYPTVGSPQDSATVTVNESQDVVVNLASPRAPTQPTPTPTATQTQAP